MVIGSSGGSISTSLQTSSRILVKRFLIVLQDDVTSLLTSGVGHPGFLPLEGILNFTFSNQSYIMGFYNLDSVIF